MPAAKSVRLDLVAQNPTGRGARSGTGRRFRDVRDESALPSTPEKIAAVQRTDAEGQKPTKNGTCISLFWSAVRSPPVCFAGL